MLSCKYNFVHESCMCCLDHVCWDMIIFLEDVGGVIHAQKYVKKSGPWKGAFDNLDILLLNYLLLLI